jgi:hypothetical protein
MFIYFRLLILFLNPNYYLDTYSNYYHLSKSDSVKIRRGFNDKILSIKIIKSKANGCKIYRFRNSKIFR